MLKISSSGTSNAGKKNMNEDNFYMNGLFIAENNASSGRIYSDNTQRGVNFYAVFDGLGEDVKSAVNPNINFYEGDTASFAAADMLSRLQRHLKTKEQFNLNNYIQSFVRKTNKNICDYINQKGGYKIGASFALLCFDGSSAYAYNIGNSKIFLLRDNRLSLISQSDTKAESMALAKQISADIARYTTDNKILTQYLGISENERPLDLHINRIHIRNGDKFLVCSDGLCEYLTPDRIFQTLSRDISEQEIVTELVNESMRREGTDNLTLIVAGVNYADDDSSKANLLKPASEDMPTHFAPIRFRNKFAFTPQLIKQIIIAALVLVAFILVIVWFFTVPLRWLTGGGSSSENETDPNPDGTQQNITEPSNNDNQSNTGNMVTTTTGYSFDIPTVDPNATDEETTEAETTAAATQPATTVAPAATTAPAVQATTVPPAQVTTTATAQITTAPPDATDAQTTVSTADLTESPEETTELAAGETTSAGEEITTEQSEQPTEEQPVTEAPTEATIEEPAVTEAPTETVTEAPVIITEAPAEAPVVIEEETIAAE